MLSDRSTVRKSIWLAWVLLSAGLIATTFATVDMKNDVEADVKRDFDFACSQIQLRIDARMDAHAQILISAAALFDASDEVTREEWHTFTMRQKVEKHLPGIQGIGFSLAIPNCQLAQHIQEIRSQGFPDYTVKPEGDREIYTSIIYLEPFSGRNLRAFGYDMFSEPIRRIAMERARDLDAAVLSGKVILVQETGQNVQAGTLMYVPVYRKGMTTDTAAQRRAALYGWVYSPYRMIDLMQGISRGWDLEAGNRIRLQIFDNEQLSADSLLYDNQPKAETETASTSQLTQQTFTAFNDHIWYLRFTQTDGRIEYGRVYGVLSGGFIISLLLFGLIISLLNTRFRAQKLAGQLNADLRESEANFRTFFESMTDMIMVGTPDGRLLFTNAAVTRTLGYSTEELATMYVLDVHQADKRLEAGEIFASMFRGERDICSLPLVCKNGKLVPVETRVWFGQWNGMNCLFGISKNLTAEQEAQQRFERLFRNNPALMALIAVKDQRFTDVNEAFLKTLGNSRGEVIGKTVAELHLFPHPEQIVAITDKLLAVERVSDLELQVRRKDGVILDGLFSGEVISSEGQQYFLTVMIDITDRKRAEDGLRHANEKLEQRVQERSRELEKINAQMVIQEKMASVGQLAAGIAHELNNPLNFVSLNFATLAEYFEDIVEMFQVYRKLAATMQKMNPYLPESEAILSKEADLQVDFILNDTPALFMESRRGFDRITRIIQSMLDFSRVDRTGEFTAFNINAGIEDTLVIARNEYKYIADVTTDLGNLQEIRCMPEQLNQVFLNLIINSAQAIEKQNRPGKGRITIRTWHNETYINCEIADDGPGIPANIQTRIFEPFFTTKPPGQGTGLGLSICYDIIVEKHKGTMAVHCPESGGTVFSIRIPISP
ncbi:MAG: CHASE domain-containing protein [Deltaproteobacteria bacterium]|jgi:PAS domain S-box-containing protein